MKKMLAVLISGVIGLSSFNVVPSASTADKGFDKNIVGSPKLAVLVDGRKIKFQGGDPISEDGRVQVPLRGVGEALGAKVDYDKAEKKVKYVKGNKSIVLTIGSKQAIVDGRIVNMDTSAKAVKGRTYVPLRFVSENLGEYVSWDQVGNWVWVGSDEVPDIADITTLKDLSPYKKYFQNDDKRYELLKNNGQDFLKVRLFDKSQFPIQMGNKTIYDIYLVKDGNENRIQVRYKGGYGLGLYLLTESSEPRERVPANGLGEVKQADGTKIANYYVSFVGDKMLLKDGDWKEFSIKDVDYICFRSYHEEDSVHLLVNPFK